MNPVEIEQALSELTEKPFDPQNFIYDFLLAFDTKELTIKRLKDPKDRRNKSELENAVLMPKQIHIATADPTTPNSVQDKLKELKNAKSTARYKPQFLLVTDGINVEAEDTYNDLFIASTFPELIDHFGFFLPLAGIKTIAQITNNPVDVRATMGFNRLYLQLLKENPHWATPDSAHEMNHFMARLIFCFFAEDTQIFAEKDIFTNTVEQMSAQNHKETHKIIAELFHAMNTHFDLRKQENVPRWAAHFPYVNGGLFHSFDKNNLQNHIPTFSSISRSYLLKIGRLNWAKINPDIFGSMIQAIADDDQRASLGMHYTSVPNILKVLNPLFLDDLKKQLEENKDSTRKLLNLRKKLARIRVFDPACGSGNFLVIAYKQLREIEHQINILRGEEGRKSDIPLTNFRGIEINDFPAEIARLALIIAEYQCDVQYRGQKTAVSEFLPLKHENWITCANALRLDWLAICPPTGEQSKAFTGDLVQDLEEITEVDFENEGEVTYICGNPPYLGSTWQDKEQKDDMKHVFDVYTKNWKSLDYVSAWFLKGALYCQQSKGAATAFVATNSICQGEQVGYLWPSIFGTGCEIDFAHTSFKWANLAAHNAGVTVIVVGISQNKPKERRLFFTDEHGQFAEKRCDYINAYLVDGKNIIVEKASKPLQELAKMEWGNKPTDGGNLFLSQAEKEELIKNYPQAALYIKNFVGAKEFIRGEVRYCLWITDEQREAAEGIPEIKARLDKVAQIRASSKAAATRPAAAFPHRFRQIQNIAQKYSLVVARVSSENRDYLPVDVRDNHTIIGDRNFALYDAPLWHLALISSRLHWVWIGAVCVRLETRFSYSNTLGWNTFPVPFLTQKNKQDLEESAENILLVRESYYPATIADLYDADKMPHDLRSAHETNDEIIERIFIGRRFRNDSERLEKLFALYAEMVEQSA